MQTAMIRSLLSSLIVSAAVAVSSGAVQASTGISKEAAWIAAALSDYHAASKGVSPCFIADHAEGADDDRDTAKSQIRLYSACLRAMQARHAKPAGLRFPEYAVFNGCSDLGADAKRVPNCANARDPRIVP
jgi:hypothetical protein